MNKPRFYFIHAIQFLVATLMGCIGIVLVAKCLYLIWGIPPIGTLYFLVPSYVIFIIFVVAHTSFQWKNLKKKFPEKSIPEIFEENRDEWEEEFQSYPKDFWLPSLFSKNRSSSLARWIIYPFSTYKTKTLFVPPGNRPTWNWSAFLFAEFWFLSNDIYGAFFLLSAIYLVLGYATLFGQMVFFSFDMLGILILIRYISGRKGNILYFYRHGRWPIGAWNNKTVEAQHGAGERRENPRVSA